MEEGTIDHRLETTSQRSRTVGRMGLLRSRPLALLKVLLLFPFQREMSRVFRDLAIGYGKPQNTQVQFMKERLTLAKQNRRQCEMQRVHQTSLQVLPDG